MKASTIVDDLSVCCICGRSPAQVHHILEGWGRRQLADEDGYIVGLCEEHHQSGKDAVHRNPLKGYDLALKQMAQGHYEQTHSRTEWIKRYGRSFL